jgi:hypothetical protein
LKSPCGGANIIFTDIETLRVKTQDIPKPLKRTGEMEDRSVIEERVNINFFWIIGV